MSQTAPLDDPFPIRRVLLPSKSADVLKGKAGEFVVLRRSEFEAHVQKAAEATRAGNNEPKLVHAFYTAKLSEDTLIDGTGMLKIVGPSVPSVLRIPKLNLALTKLDAGDAILGEFNNQAGLLTGRSGAQEVSFSWSLRGKARAESTDFEFHAPAGASSVLEVITPTGHELTTMSPSLLVLDQSEGGAVRSRTWRIHFTEASPLRFSVRRPLLPHPTKSPVLVQAKTRQTLFPGRVLSEHEFLMESASPDRREFLLDCPPTLVPLDVTSPNLAIESWELKSAAIVVRLKQPCALPAGVLLVRCASEPPPDGRWTSPALQMRDAVLLRETLHLSIKPGLQLDAFNPGDMRVAATSSEEDGGHVIALLGGGDSRLRPKATLKLLEPRGYADQQTRWTVGSTSSTLVVDLSLHLTTPKLFQVALSLPKSTRPWHVESIEFSPKGVLRGWSVVGQTVLIDLTRPMSAGEVGAAKLTMTSTHGSSPKQEMVLDFPDVDPGPSFLRRGSLDIRLADVQEASVLQSSSSPAPASSETPGFVYHHRGPAPTGKLRVVPPPLAAAEAKTVSKDDPAPTPADPGSKAVPVLSDVKLLTSADRANLSNYFEFTVTDWPHIDFPVTLPANTTEVSALSVNSHWVDRCTTERTNDGVLLRVPLAGDTARSKVEIRYSTSGALPVLVPWGVIESDSPVTPIPVVAMSRVWQIPQGWEPMSRSSLRPVKDQRQTPSTLVDRIWNGADGLFSKPANSKEDGLSSALSEYSDWEGTATSFIVVNRAMLRWLGVLLGVGVLALVLWFRWLVQSLPAYLCSLLVLVIAVVWLPHSLQETALWPFVVLVGLGLFNYVAALVRIEQLSRQVPPTQRISKTIVTGSAILLVAWSALSGQSVSQEPPAQVVYILGDVLDVEKQTVLAPPELLKRLESTAANLSSPRASAAVITGSLYSGKIAGKLANFRAEFKVHALADKTELNLPLLDVDLEEGASLDGEPVYPSPHAGGGYTVPIPSKGDHTLVMPFKVRLAVQEGQRTLKFGIPRVFQTRLQVALPPGAQFSRLRSGHGDVQFDAGILNGSLGNDSTVHVVWREDDNIAPDISANEAYLWDLQQGASLVTAKYRVTAAGPISKLALILPEQYELKSIEVKGEGTNAGGLPIRTSYSGTEGTSHRLEVGFADPVSGPLDMTVQLLDPAPMAIKPKTAIATRPFRLPHIEGAKMTLGLMALRSSVMHHTAQGQGLALTPVSRDAFEKLWHVPDSARLASTYSFRRAGANPALVATLSPPLRKANQTITWLVDAQNSDLTADIRITSADIDLVLVEFDAPEAVTISNVAGPQVRSWTRAESVVQVWLAEPVKEATFVVSGWTKNAVRALPPKEGRFVVPAIRMLNAQATTKLQVRPAPSISLDLLTAKQLTKGDSAGTFYTTGTPNYEATFRVRAAVPVLHVKQPSVTSHQAPSPKVPEKQLSSDAEVPAQKHETKAPVETRPEREPTDSENERALNVTGAIVLLLLVLWLISCLPHALVWLRFFWPEQILGVAILGWFCLGPSLVGGMLATCGIAARLLIVIRALGSKSKVTETTSSFGSSS